jgi:hypothetical protein
MEGTVIKCYAESNIPKLMKSWSALHEAKAADVDGVLLQSIRQHPSKSFHLIDYDTFSCILSTC